ncbi:very low-density lipoprotein receptor-like [Penaeus monodon]|uniref:very low-density lipoprotein receptor-like n=1 Tax=Penaeus monodon TaxID=6687 RepID=UPI0018A6D5AC|nr:very low-density lipoprotein receptor-like [Penaeus monodon]
MVFKQCADGSDEDHEVCATSGCSRGIRGKCIDPICIVMEWMIVKMDLMKANCQSFECPEEAFIALLCDGTESCVDGSDKASCDSFQCPEDRSYKCDSGELPDIRCSSGNGFFWQLACDGGFNAKMEVMKIIARTKLLWGRILLECRRPYHRCDGFVQCSDGSDEINARNFTCPDKTAFQMCFGICITLYQICKGFDDCGDGSVKFDCQDSSVLLRTAFQCPEGTVFPSLLYVMGTGTALEAAMKKIVRTTRCNVPKSLSFEAEKQMHKVSWVCDDFEDCSDGSDEEKLRLSGYCQMYTKPECAYMAIKMGAEKENWPLEAVI